MDITYYNEKLLRHFLSDLGYDVRSQAYEESMEKVINHIEQERLKNLFTYLPNDLDVERYLTVLQLLQHLNDKCFKYKEVDEIIIFCTIKAWELQIKDSWKDWTYLSNWTPYTIDDRLENPSNWFSLFLKFKHLNFLSSLGRFSLGIDFIEDEEQTNALNLTKKHPILLYEIANNYILAFESERIRDFFSEEEKERLLNKYDKFIESAFEQFPGNYLLNFAEAKVSIIKNDFLNKGSFKYEDILENLTEVIELRIDFFEPYLERAKILTEMYRFEDAEKDYITAIKLYPNTDLYYEYSKFLHQKMKNGKRALEMMNNSVVLSSKHVGFRGELLEESGRLKEALEDFIESGYVSTDSSFSYSNNQVIRVVEKMKKLGIYRDHYTANYRYNMCEMGLSHIVRKLYN